MERKLGIGSDCMLELADELTAMEMIRAVGFEVITTNSYTPKEVCAIKEKADKLGLGVPFLHAPFSGINKMWLAGDEYRGIYDGMITAIDSAASFAIPAVVCHVSSGWQAPPVNDLGLSRYDALVDYAAQKGVTVAFENLRMVGNLACLIDRYDGRDNVRYCFDCGHEHCYTKTVRWLDIFTDKLIATHIHDNPGRPFEDKVHDFDTHWLPFDGTYDYHTMMRKMNEYRYEGPLVLEVFRAVRPDYEMYDAEGFLKTCYDRIKRISLL